MTRWKQEFIDRFVGFDADGCPVWITPDPEEVVAWINKLMRGENSDEDYMEIARTLVRRQWARSKEIGAQIDYQETLKSGANHDGNRKQKRRKEHEKHRASLLEEKDV